MGMHKHTSAGRRQSCHAPSCAAACLCRFALLGAQMIALLAALCRFVLLGVQRSAETSRPLTCPMITCCIRARHSGSCLN
jgi:hypothetical protein